jgi:hypothetical protein
MAGQGRKELREMRFQLQANNTHIVDTMPTVVWRGIAGMISDEREVVNPEEEIGIFGGGLERSYIPKLMATISVPDTEATFEQLDWLFLASGFIPRHGTTIADLVGSSLGVTGSAVQQSLIAPTRSAPPTYSYAIASGDDAEVEKAGYALCTKISLSFPAGEAVKVSSEWMAAYGTRANAAGTFQGSGTIPTVETILASRGTVRWAIDGTNFAQVPAGNLLGGKLDITPRWEPKFSIDSGSLQFATAVFTGFDVEGEITWEHQGDGSYSVAGTAGQLERWRSQQTQAVWLEFTGGTIPDGTMFPFKTLRIILPMRWTEYDTIDDQNGNDTRTGKFISRYDVNYPSLGRGSVTIVRRGTFEHNQPI